MTTHLKLNLQDRCFYNLQSLTSVPILSTRVYDELVKNSSAKAEENGDKHSDDSKSTYRVRSFNTLETKKPQG